ncbi:TPA: glycosyltransferase family 9 protein [bacterium]|nr:glycosyltransferase family 9 protein [bacterium]
MKIKENRFVKTIEEYTTLVLSSFINIKFRHKIGYNSDDIRNIAIIKLDHIGDVILSIPALNNIRNRFPNVKITMVVNPSSKSIAEFIPYIDDVVCYNARFFDRSGSAKMFDIIKGIRFAFDMKKRDFDLIVDLRGSFASIFFAIVSKSKYRIDRGSYLLKRKIKRQKNNVIRDSFAIKQKGDRYTLKHEAEIGLDILSKAGIDIITRESNLKNPDFSMINLPSNLLQRENMKEELIITIHPGGPMLQKRWSADNYIELIKLILSNLDSKILLIGGKDETELVGSIFSAVNDERVVDLSGKLSISQLLYNLWVTDLFIGNDSGPMHIASACGTKVIGLYGPTDPERFGPFGKNCIALRMEKKCPPCSHGNCRFNNYRCIDQISVKDVMDTINDILNIKL